MTDEFKQYIDGLCRYCKKETFHGEYQSKLRYSSEPDSSDDNHSITYMSVKWDTVYLWVTITIYPASEDMWNEKRYDGIGDNMMHEFCHGFIEPVYHALKWNVSPNERSAMHDIIERQTQRIANAIVDILPRGWANPETLMNKGFIKVDPFKDVT